MTTNIVTDTTATMMTVSFGIPAENKTMGEVRPRNESPWSDGTEQSNKSFVSHDIKEIYSLNWSNMLGSRKRL